MRRRGLPQFSISMSQASSPTGACCVAGRRQPAAPRSSRPMLTVSGATVVAAALAAAGCRWFFVATLDEGIALRRALPDIARSRSSTARSRVRPRNSPKHRLVPVLNDPGQIADWQALGGTAAPAGDAADRYRDGAARSDSARIRPVCRRPSAARSDRLAGRVEPPRLCRRTRDHPMNRTAATPLRRGARSGLPAGRQVSRPLPEFFSAASITSISFVRARRSMASTRSRARPEPDAAGRPP